MRMAINPPRCVRTLGILSMAIGFSALSGWIFRIPLLASYSVTLKPMAPSSGVFFILFGAVLFLQYSLPKNRTVYFVRLTVSTLSALATSLILLFSLRGIRFPIESLGLSIPVTLGAMPIGYMSPFTAVCFVLIGISFLFILFPPEAKSKCNWAAFLIAGLVILGSSILLLGYLYGAPLMYGGENNPPSLPTSLGLLVFGTGLLIISGVRIFENDKREGKSASFTLFSIFMLFALGIIAGGYFYFKHSERIFRTTVEDQLSAIADLKVKQISKWYIDELHDAALFSRNTVLVERTGRWLKGRKAGDRAEVLASLSSLKDEHDYAEILIASNQGRILLSTDTTAGLDPFLVDVVKQTLEIRATVSSDLYRCSADKRIYIDFVSPISKGTKTIPAALVLRMDAHNFLFPFVESWPTPSRTAETLLIRRDDDEVIFLNELRHQKNSALSLRFSIKNVNLSAVKAVRGQEGIVEGKDYRGVPVIADVRAVPDSPWFLVSKIDREEIYAPLRRRLREILASVCMLLLAAGSGVGMVWRHQRSRFYKERWLAAKDIQRLNRMLTVLSNINEAIVRVSEPQKLFDEACRIAVEDGGFRMTWIGLFDDTSETVNVVASAGATEDYLHKLDIRMNDPVRSAGPTGRALKSGSHVICADIEHDPSMAPWRENALRMGYRSSAAFPLIVSGQIRGSFNFYSAELDFFSEEEVKLLDELAMDVSYAIEVTEKEAIRKQAEEALRISEERYRRAQTIGHVGNWEYNLQTAHFWGSPEAKRIYGFDPEQPDFSTDEVENCIPERESVHQALVDLIEAGKPYNLEFEIHPRNSSEPTIISSVAELLCDEHGNPLKVVGVIQDVTERKRAEEALRRERELLGRITETSPVGITMVNRDGQIIFANHQSEQVLGLTKDEIAQRTYNAPVWRITDFQGNPFPEGQLPFQRVIASGKPVFDVQHAIEWPDGRRVFLSINGVPLMNELGEVESVVFTLEDITARRQAEMALSESEERLRVATEATQIGIWDWDLKHDIWFASPTYYTMLGYKPVTGPSDRSVWLTRVHPDDKEAVAKKIQGILDGITTNYQYEARMKHADGSYRWHSVIGSTVEKGEDGKPIRLMGVRIDITDHKRAEEALQESEQKFRRMSEQSLLAIGFIQDGLFKYINQAYCGISGYSIDEIMNWKPYEFAKTVHPDDREFVMEQVRKKESGASDVVGHYQFKGVAKSGEIKWLELYSKTILYRERNADLVMFIDITDRRQAQEELERIKILLSEGQELAHSGSWEYKIDTQETFWSEEEFRIYGLTLGSKSPSYNELLTKHIHPDDADLVDKTFGDALQRKSIFELEHRIVRPDGSVRSLYNRARPHCDKTGKLLKYTGTTVDITDRKKAEEQIRKDLEEKEILLKEIHHRVKNNLTVISSLLNLQSKHIKTKQQALEAFKESRDRVFAMALVHEKLYQSSDFSSINMKSYLDEMAGQLIKMYCVAQDVRLKLDIQAAVIDINRAIPCGLILNELITNALKYAFPKGRKGEITVSFHPFEETFYELIVSDDGLGLPDDLDVENSPSLGLHLVRLLTSQLNGSWRVSREKGTSFHIRFPQTEG